MFFLLFVLCVVFVFVLCLCVVFVVFFCYVFIFCVSFCVLCVWLYVHLMCFPRRFVTLERKPRSAGSVRPVCSRHGGCVINYHRASMVKIVLHLYSQLNTYKSVASI